MSFKSFSTKQHGSESTCKGDSRRTFLHGIGVLGAASAVSVAGGRASASQQRPRCVAKLEGGRARRGSMVFELNETGSWLLSQCDGRRSTSELIRGMASRFSVSEAAAGADVESYLSQLYKAGLVV